MTRDGFKISRGGLSGLALLFKREMVIFIPCSQIREAKGNKYVLTLCFLGILLLTSSNVTYVATLRQDWAGSLYITEKYTYTREVQANK